MEGIKSLPFLQHSKLGHWRLRNVLFSKSQIAQNKDHVLLIERNNGLHSPQWQKGLTIDISDLVFDKHNLISWAYRRGDLVLRLLARTTIKSYQNSKSVPLTSGSVLRPELASREISIHDVQDSVEARAVRPDGLPPLGGSQWHDATISGLNFRDIFRPFLPVQIL